MLAVILCKQKLQRFFLHFKACFTNFETIPADPNIGIPFWFVKGSKDVLRDYDIISSQLKNSIQYQLDEKDNLILEPEIFTIVRNPDSRNIREPSPVFILLNSFEQSLPWRLNFVSRFNGIQCVFLNLAPWQTLLCAYVFFCSEFQTFNSDLSFNFIFY